MNNYINYMIEANLLLIVFGLIYFLFIKAEIDFKFRRFFILGSIIISLATPLLPVNLPVSQSVNIVNEVETIILPEVVVGDTKAASNTVSLNWMAYLRLAYWIGVIIIGQLFIFQLMQVTWFFIANRKNSTSDQGHKIINTNGTLPTFSFFNLLFYDNSIQLSEVEKKRILEHEKTHINQYHSIDIILIEVMKTMSWFNPIAWLLKREIQDVHEYLADLRASKEVCSDQYASLLAKMALAKAHLSIGHHFNKSKTLKRIAMLKKTKRGIQQWKKVMLIPIALSTVIVISCNDEVIKEVEQVMETATQLDVPSELVPTVEKLQREYPQAKFIYIEADPNSEESMNNLMAIDPKTIAHIQVRKDRKMIGALINKNGALEKAVARYNQKDNVYTLIDEPAMPEGGYKEFYKRIAFTIKYPKQARKMGIEGKVYVQFIIDEAGALTNAQVVKGIGGGCDEEAVKAVNNSGKWTTPRTNGQSVKQRIILPITFSLDKSSKV